MYYDGKEVASANAVGKLIQNNLPINIGKGVQRNYNTDAVIDEVRIYNRVLSEAEIANTYQKSMTQCVEAQLYCSNPELTAVWKMDEGIGVVAGDSTANNLDGTLKNGLNNTGWKTGADCQFTDGKCLEFDGVNNAFDDLNTTEDGDYIRVPDSPELDFGTNPFTVEGWIKMPDSTTISADGSIIAKQNSGSVQICGHTHQNDGRLFFESTRALQMRIPKIIVLSILLKLTIINGIILPRYAKDGC